MGSAVKLCVNCRHNFSPAFPQLGFPPRYTEEQLKAFSEQTYTVTNGKGEQETLGAYEASQRLRAIERRIRELKTRVELKKKTGTDHAPDSKLLKQWYAKRRLLVKETGLRSYSYRVKI
jgi:hypothetical protein